jgi:hypothetical protein
MANADNTTEETPNLSHDKWPHEPEGMIEFMPDDLNGSPYDMLFNVLTRAQGVIAVLCSEFMGDDDYRPKAHDIVGALWTAQSQLKLALDLMERLDVVNSNAID